MRTPVIILRGRHRNRVGTIAGELHNRNRHVTKAVVRFSDTEWSTFDLSMLEPADTQAQGELAL